MEFLEWDHIVPICRGGESTLENIRLLCRAHNQRAADRTIGRAYMEGRRAQARERKEAAVLAATAAAAGPNAEHLADIECVLSTFKVRKSEARRLAADVCASLPPGSSLEECAKAALKTFGPTVMRKNPPAA
jgi:hypothetical protein